MPTILLRSLLFLVFETFTFILINAQGANEVTGKIIEVHSGRSPRPSVFALYREQDSGFWASGFPRLKDWKLPGTGDPVQAMDFKARLVGDKCELRISLFTGKRFGENVEFIARVVVSEGETIVVSELKKLGFEPVTVKMLATPTVMADVPLVTNPAPLLRTTVSNVVATLPTFNIKFENDSSKEIMAFVWHTETDGHRLLSSIAQERYGNVLMEVSGTYEMNIKAVKLEGENNPVTMVINAVIYKDGSFDGNQKSAASFLTAADGHKKALEQLVPILQKATEKGSGRADVASLIARIDALTDGSPRPNGRPSTPQGIAFASVITEAVGRLHDLDQEFSGKSDAERAAGLGKIAIFYRDWQTRMNL